MPFGAEVLQKTTNILIIEKTKRYWYFSKICFVNSDPLMN